MTYKCDTNVNCFVHWTKVIQLNYLSCEGCEIRAMVLLSSNILATEHV
jgi:hypothetical protein